MKVYLGMYVSNVHNTQTPLAEWFDDAAWSSIVDPAVDRFVTEAAFDKFDGIAIDQELYPQDGNTRTATWNADYPRRTRPENAVRVQVRRRGAHLMRTILDGFPHAEILVYGTAFPETFDSIVQKQVNDVNDAYRDSVQIDFWDGMTSTDGYDAIRFVNALFYKIPQRGSWDEALRYDVNAFYAVASRHFSNWGNASSRVFESPFSWIDSGTSKFERSRSPDAVRQQLDAFRKWGTGGEFANYAQQSLSTFDYGPYVSALQQAANPGVVDRDVPTLEVAPPAPHGSSLDLDGTADDNLGVRVVRWSTAAGATGVATMTFDVPDNEVSSVGQARMHWHIAAIPLRPASNTVTVTVEDIKGNATSQTVSVDA